MVAMLGDGRSRETAIDGDGKVLRLFHFQNTWAPGSLPYTMYSVSSTTR